MVFRSKIGKQQARMNSFGTTCITINIFFFRKMPPGDHVFSKKKFNNVSCQVEKVCGCSDDDACGGPSRPIYPPPSVDIINETLVWIRYGFN